jgi:DNA repair protein RadC
VEKEYWQKKGEGHRGRLRDRFLDRGLDGFTDAEVLELLLTFGTPRSDCKEQARALLNSFGSLAAVLEAPMKQLLEVKGVGPKNSFAIRFVQSVARRYLQERLKGKHYLHSAKEVTDFLQHALRGLKKEVFMAIFLDASHAILDTKVIAEGTINVNTVYPRELVVQSLEMHAAALIIAHNHPSGALKPSPQDIHLTRTLFVICSWLQIQLLDHLIIGDGYFSFSESGLMSRIQNESSSLLSSIR